MTAASTAGQPVPPTRTWLAIGFVCATLVTTLLTAGGNALLANYQATRSETIQSAGAFDKSAQPFRHLVANYVSDVIAERNPAASKKALQDNIYDQDATLRSAMNHLDGDERQAAERYLGTLADLADALEGTSNPGNAMPFARLALQADQDAQSVNNNLRQKAGLATSAE